MNFGKVLRSNQIAEDANIVDWVKILQFFSKAFVADKGPNHSK